MKKLNENNQVKSISLHDMLGYAHQKPYAFGKDFFECTYEESVIISQIADMTSRRKKLCKTILNGDRDKKTNRELKQAVLAMTIKIEKWENDLMCLIEKSCTKKVSNE